MFVNEMITSDIKNNNASPNLNYEKQLMLLLPYEQKR